jgi:TRAP-type C4-dicarboxylate transport system substrate-binding protein
VLNVDQYAFAGNDPKVLIKMATIAPRGSYMMQMIDKMDAEIRRETDNEVGIKLYYGGVQGDESDVLRKIRLGQLHGGAFTGSGLGRIASAVRVTEVPYLFMNYDEVEHVRNALRPEMEKMLEKEGFIVLGWNEVGFVYNFSKVPITSIDIARSQKWWMWEGDELSKAMFDAYGITPVPLSFTDVMTSLNTKLIDTASITPYGAVAYHWYEKFDYMSEYPTTNVQGGTIVVKKVWDKISPENQQKIKKICQPYFDDLSIHGREQNRKSVEVLKKAGIKVVVFDPEKDKERLQFVFDTAKKARENLAGKLYSKELLDRTLSLLNEYRKAHPDNAIMKLR